MKFPKTLYVKIEKDSGTEYFVSDEDAACLVQMGDTIKVAAYKLMDVSDATGVAEFKQPRRKAR